MSLPADFSKIFGSTATGGLTPISDVNYAKGWEFVGANPPTKNDFSYLQNLSDLKSQWLYSNKLKRTDPFGDIKSDGTAQTALANLGFGQSVEREGYLIWPGGLIMQWGTLTGDQGNLGAGYPIAFKERVFQVLLSLNDKTEGAVDGISLYATRDNFTNKTTLIVQNKGKDLLGVTTASYFAIGK